MEMIKLFKVSSLPNTLNNRINIQITNDRPTGVHPKTNRLGKSIRISLVARPSTS